MSAFYLTTLLLWDKIPAEYTNGLLVFLPFITSFITGGIISLIEIKDKYKYLSSTTLIGFLSIAFLLVVEGALGILAYLLSVYVFQPRANDILLAIVAAVGSKGVIASWFGNEAKRVAKNMTSSHNLNIGQRVLHILETLRIILENRIGNDIADYSHSLAEQIVKAYSDINELNTILWREIDAREHILGREQANAFKARTPGIVRHPQMADESKKECLARMLIEVITEKGVKRIIEKKKPNLPWRLRLRLVFRQRA